MNDPLDKALQALRDSTPSPPHESQTRADLLATLDQLSEKKSGGRMIRLFWVAAAAAIIISVGWLILSPSEEPTVTQEPIPQADEPIYHGLSLGDLQFLADFAISFPNLVPLDYHYYAGTASPDTIWMYFTCGEGVYISGWLTFTQSKHPLYTIDTTDMLTQTVHVQDQPGEFYTGFYYPPEVNDAAAIDIGASQHILRWSSNDIYYEIRKTNESQEYLGNFACNLTREDLLVIAKDMRPNEMENVESNIILEPSLFEFGSPTAPKGESISFEEAQAQTEFFIPKIENNYYRLQDVLQDGDTITQVYEFGGDNSNTMHLTIGPIADTSPIMPENFSSIPSESLVRWINIGDIETGEYTTSYNLMSYLYEAEQSNRLRWLRGDIAYELYTDYRFNDGEAADILSTIAENLIKQDGDTLYRLRNVEHVMPTIVDFDNLRQLKDSTDYPVMTLGAIPENYKVTHIAFVPDKHIVLQSFACGTSESIGLTQIKSSYLTIASLATDTEVETVQLGSITARYYSGGWEITEGFEDDSDYWVSTWQHRALGRQALEWNVNGVSYYLWYNNIQYIEECKLDKEMFIELARSLVPIE